MRARRRDNSSKEALVEVLAEPAQNLLINRLGVLYLTLRLPKLNVWRWHVRVLRFVELVAIFELLLKNRQIGPPLLKSRNVLLRDLWADLWADERCLLSGLLHWCKILVSLPVLLLVTRRELWAETSHRIAVVLLTYVLHLLFLEAALVARRCGCSTATTNRSPHTIIIVLLFLFQNRATRWFLKGHFSLFFHDLGWLRLATSLLVCGIDCGGCWFEVRCGTELLVHLSDLGLQFG